VGSVTIRQEYAITLYVEPKGRTTMRHIGPVTIAEDMGVKQYIMLQGYARSDQMHRVNLARVDILQDHQHINV